MGELPAISNAEWAVMNLVWDDHPTTAQDLVRILGPDTGWSARTVKTLLARLVKKKVLGYREQGRRYHYHPLLTRDECLSDVSRSFLARVGGSSQSPLLAHFVRQSRLSAEEIAELRSLLDEKQARP